MQRKLLICRHAEAEDPYPLQPDFERELTSYGSQQARDTAKWLRENFSKVDKIISSPAKRASQTTRIIAGKLYFDEEMVNYEPDLYNAKEHQLVKVLSELPADKTTVLLVGHNPGITKLVRELADEMLGYLDTAQAICIQIELESWEQIYYTTGVVFSRTGQKV
ncbi:SixA phosphatase family protein [Pontibacter sp. H249]|uniref:SixA phosphatase family protein n=1 Tax=Pontibacter sp. H249 TaxID=3133420 RepID=UPI0030C38C2A